MVLSSDGIPIDNVASCSVCYEGSTKTSKKERYSEFVNVHVREEGPARDIGKEVGDYVLITRKEALSIPLR